MSKPKIVWLSDSPFTETGYATISKNLLNRLSDEFECHYLAHNYIGQSMPPGNKLVGGETLNFHIHGQGQMPYCQDKITPLIRKLKANVFSTLLDTFMVWPWYMNHDFSPARTVFYYPSDGGGGLPLQCENIVKRMHQPVAMSTFARIQAKDYYGVDTPAIPLAIDTKHYKPDNKTRDLGRERYGLVDKFIVGCVAR